jgi:hypothetical protein
MQLREMHRMAQVSVMFLLLCFSICNAAQYGAKRRVEASSDGLYYC